MSTGDAKRRRGQKPGSKGHGHGDYSKLETEQQIHDLSEDEKVCPRCGADNERLGEETSDQVDWPVRIVHRRPTYPRSCRCGPPG